MLLDYVARVIRPVVVYQLSDTFYSDMDVVR